MKASGGISSSFTTSFALRTVLSTTSAIEIEPTPIVNARTMVSNNIAIRFGYPFQETRFSILRMFIDEGDHLFGYFENSLVKLGLVRVTPNETCHEFIEIHGLVDDQFHSIWLVNW